MRLAIVALLLLAACERSSESGERLVVEVSRHVGMHAPIPVVAPPRGTAKALLSLADAACRCRERSCSERAEEALNVWEASPGHDHDRDYQLDYIGHAETRIYDCISMVERGPAPLTPAEGGATTGLAPCDEYQVASARLARCGLSEDEGLHTQAYRWAIEEQRKSIARMSAAQRDAWEQQCRSELADVKRGEQELGCDP